MIWDVNLTIAINKSWANRLFDYLMPYVTYGGSGKVIFVLAVFLLLFRGRRFAGILLLSGLTVSYYIVDFLKDLAARPRPFAAIAGIRQLAEASGYSFPSGHAVLAFMTAAVLSRFFGRRTAFFTAACMVGYSRIYLGVHYFSDVLAGAALGFVIGCSITALVREKYLTL